MGLTKRAEYFVNEGRILKRSPHGLHRPKASPAGCIYLRQWRILRLLALVTPLAHHDCMKFIKTTDLTPADRKALKAILEEIKK